MNQNSGSYVFRDKNDTATLIAYKKLPDMRYLILLHYNKVLNSYYSNYQSLLNTIPIRSLSLPVFLPILKNRKETINTWYKLLINAMRDY